MRRGYKKYRPKYAKPRYTKIKLFFADKEIDFTSDKLDYNHFLLTEFFHTNIFSDSNKFAVQYSNIFGTYALSYLRRNFDTWKHGNYHLTDLIRERVLQLMPKFLSDDAKHRLSVHEFIASIKKTVKSEVTKRNQIIKNKLEFKSSLEIVTAFEAELDRIQNSELRSAGYTDLLSTDEKIEALEISKYILETKLQISFNQVERDFKIFLPQMAKLKKGIFRASYSISYLNVIVEISKLSGDAIMLPKFEIKDIQVNSRFKSYADKYLAYELLDIDSAKKNSSINALLNETDLAIFLDSYEELSHSKKEVNMTSKLFGEGGFLTIEISMKPVGQIHSDIAKSLVKLVCYLVVLLTIIGIASFLSLGVIVAIMLYGGFIITIGFIGVISNEIRNFRALTIELKRHGK